MNWTAQAGGQVRELFEDFAGIGGEDFGSGARGGSAEISNEVGDGEIDLVPHGAYNRDR